MFKGVPTVRLFTGLIGKGFLIICALAISLVPVSVEFPRQNGGAQAAATIVSTDTVLEVPAKPTVDQFINTTITLSLPGEDFVLAAPALFFFLEPAGTGLASIKPEKIRHLVWALAQNQIDRSVKNTLVTITTGEVAQVGVAGRRLNQPALVNELYRVATGQANNPIDLTQLVTTIAPETIAMNNPAPKLIVVDLSDQKMKLYDQGKEIATHTVSTGKWSTPTPKGEFMVLNHQAYAYSKPFKLYMPFWLGLKDKSTGRYLGYGIHELPEWGKARKVKEAITHLGRPASHGCIRLGVGTAEQVYRWADNGTTVIIHS